MALKVQGSMPPSTPTAEQKAQNPFLDTGHINKVISMKDPVQRNYAITSGYHALSEGMSGLLGKENANWLTFGKWASVEAGRAIRQETVPGLVRGTFIGKGVSEGVANGNKAIFGDIGPHFARFINTFENDTSWKDNPARGQAMMDQFSAHPSMAGKTDLQNAFRAYQDALQLKGKTDPASVNKRDESMMKANTLVAAHEQMVADKYVKDAVPMSGIMARFATSQMKLEIPSASLALNQDVGKPRYLGGGQQFPGQLQTIEDKGVQDLAKRFGQDINSTKNSDASNWENYGDRMGYIFNFFRAYQQDPSLQQRPNIPTVRPD